MSFTETLPRAHHAVEVSPPPWRPEYPDSTVTIPQYSRRSIVAVWAAAAIPMGVLSWVVAPIVARSLDGEFGLVRALLASLTVGLVWQFVLVMALVRREQGNLRWATVRDALWLRRPQSPKDGRIGGKTWLVVIPLMLAVALEEVLNVVPAVGGRDMGEILGTDSGQAFMHGAWGWFAVLVTMSLFNTVLGEELLFRGFLLPRMHGAFGRRDGLVNGLLFAAYHLHVPWMIPVSMVDGYIYSYPSKRRRSAWIGIAVHSAQSVFIIVAVFALVVS
jgi:uncharacterized protein